MSPGIVRVTARGFILFCFISLSLWPASGPLLRPTLSCRHSLRRAALASFLFFLSLCHGDSTVLLQGEVIVSCSGDCGYLGIGADKSTPSPNQGHHAGGLRKAFPVSLGREGERDTQARGLTRDRVWRCLSEKLSFKWHFKSKSEAPSAVPFCDGDILPSQLPVSTRRHFQPGSSSLEVIFDSVYPCSAGERASPTPVQHCLGHGRCGSYHPGRERAASWKEPFRHSL